MSDKMSPVRWLGLVLLLMFGGINFFKGAAIVYDILHLLVSLFVVEILHVVILTHGEIVKQARRHTD